MAMLAGGFIALHDPMIAAKHPLGRRIGRLVVVATGRTAPLRSTRTTRIGTRMAGVQPRRGGGEQIARQQQRSRQSSKNRMHRRNHLRRHNTRRAKSLGNPLGERPAGAASGRHPPSVSLPQTKSYRLSDHICQSSAGQAFVVAPDGNGGSTRQKWARCGCSSRGNW